MNSSAINPSSVASASGVSLEGNIDLQTAATLVYMERGTILDNRAREQMLRMKAQNNSLKTLGDLMSQSSVNEFSAGALDQANKLNASEKDGKVVVQIGDGYTLEVPKSNTAQTWTLKDKGGNTVRIFGDPYVDESDEVRGQKNQWNQGYDWEFKQQSTFVLKDGTKINVATTPFKGSGNFTVTSALTITRGDESVQITGIDNNQVKFSETQTGGRQLDASTNDGHIVYVRNSFAIWV
ncbi:hypothetical protein CCP4SC76_3160002 [Gammaproteobacteria bacterium]